MAAPPDGEITVLVNIGSGGQDGREVRDRIADTLSESGRPFRIVELEPGTDLRATVRETVARDAGKQCMIAVSGGDGTINSVASELVGTGVPLGVIPSGTFNLLARDYGIPSDPVAATEAMLDGIPREVDAVRLNEHIFLSNASIGLYRRTLEERERVKQRLGRYRPVAALSTVLTLLRHHRAYDLELVIDGKTTQLRTSMLFFAFNPLQLEFLDLEDRADVRSGEMAVLVLEPVGRWALLGLALRGAVVGFAHADNLETYRATAVEVRPRGRFRSRRVSVAIDGEVVHTRSPLRVEVMRGALTLVTPREPVERR